jgi:hypothetical protein
MLIGASATILSAITATAIFEKFTSQIAQDVQDRVIFGWRGVLILTVSVLALIAISADTYRKDPQQAEQHQAAWAGYLSSQHQIDLFRLRYANSDSKSREKALEELARIVERINVVTESSKLTLTESAYKRAVVEFKQRHQN